MTCPIVPQNGGEVNRPWYPNRVKTFGPQEVQRISLSMALQY